MNRIGPALPIPKIDVSVCSYCENQMKNIVMYIVTMTPRPLSSYCLFFAITFVLTDIRNKI